jgi:hypothetical protein
LEKFEALKKKGRFGPEDLNSLDLGTTLPVSGDNHASAMNKTTLSPV